MGTRRRRNLLDSRGFARRALESKRRFRVRASMMIAVAVAAFGLAAWATVPAIGQDKPVESGALDPRLRPLVGTWEGRVELKQSREEQGRVLVIQEKAGHLEGRFGPPDKGLERVGLATDLDGGRRQHVCPRARQGRLAVREDDPHRRQPRQHFARPAGFPRAEEVAGGYSAVRRSPTSSSSAFASESLTLADRTACRPNSPSASNRY